MIVAIEVFSDRLKSHTTYSGDERNTQYPYGINAEIRDSLDYYFSSFADKSEINSKLGTYRIGLVYSKDNNLITQNKIGYL